MLKKRGWVLMLVLLISMLLTACVDSASDDGGTKDGKDDGDKGEAKQGGKVTYGFAEPFKGILEAGLYEGEDDGNIIDLMMDSLVETNDELKPEPGMADYDIDEDKNTITFTLKDGIKWQDGEPVTAEDIAFAYEVIADPDYTGPRYSNVSMIKGADKYHAGDADDISGLDVKNDKTIVVTLDHLAPNSLDNLWSYPMPKHYYKDVDVADLEDSDQVRKKPIGTGPYKVKKIVPGEMVELERNDDYWQGKPNLDTVVYKVIDSSLASGALENGEIDILKIPASQYEDIKKLDNVKLDKEPALSYSYIGFKLGHWDKKKKKSIMDNDKFQNKKLRKAMAYAIDRKGMLDSFSNGLGETLEAPMPPVSWAKADDSKLTKYDYDPEKAKKLLDEAGYKDVDGDGVREDPDGKKFHVNFDAMSGSDISEPRAQYILQNWQDVGLDAKLNGGLKEMNLFYDTVESDDKSVDTFMGAWGLASDPDPTGLMKSDDEWNYSRWVNKESDKLIEDGISDKGFDQDYRKDVYQKWQELVNDELPSIFLYAPVDVMAVNKRVKNVHVNSFNSGLSDTQKWWVDDADDDSK